MDTRQPGALRRVSVGHLKIVGAERPQPQRLNLPISSLLLPNRLSLLEEFVNSFVD